MPVLKMLESTVLVRVCVCEGENEDRQDRKMKSKGREGGREGGVCE